jgi:hypothetical protein
MKKLGGENDKKVFSFSLKVLSNEHQQDQHLSSFFSGLNNSIPNKEMIEIIKNLSTCESIGSNFPVIVNFLFDIMIKNEMDQEIQLESFNCLMSIVNSFQKGKNENHKQLVPYYVKFIFKRHEIIKILPLFNKYLKDENNSKEKFFDIFWFIFSITLKSIGILRSQHQHEYQENILNSLIEELISNLISQISNDIKTHFNSVEILTFELASFLRTLSMIMDQ